MIISPPFLPESGLTSTDGSKPDPMMDAVDKFELAHGIYPIAYDRHWHCGVHLAPSDHGPVYAIADGEVVAYRVCQHAMDFGNGNAGFVLLKHSTETGDGRTMTFYSLYMHLLPLAEYHTFGFDDTGLADFLQKPSGPDAEGQVTPAAKGNGQKVLRKDTLEYREHYRNAINVVFRKYRICDPIRSAHFFGQSAIESAHMMIVRECSVAISTAIKANHISIMPELNGYLRSPPAAAKDVAYFTKYDGNMELGNTDAGDGIKFRGRGFKQLTGRYNYSEYWVYRGWLDRKSYDHAWFKKKEGGHFKAGPEVDNPEILGNDAYSCVDAAGFFCVHTSLEKAVDQGISESSSRAVTKIVNPYDVKSPPLRWKETEKAYRVLGDKS